MTDDPQDRGRAAAPDDIPGDGEHAAHGAGGDSRADDQARAPGGELFTQFEVIRRVLDAHKSAEATTANEPSVGSRPAQDPGTRRPEGPSEAGPELGGAPRAPVLDALSEHPPSEVDTVDTFADPREGGRRLGLVAAVAALSVFVAGAGAATLYYAGDHGVKPGTSAASAEAAAAASAVPTAQTLGVVSWVLSSVGPSEVVACDVSVCALLRAHGFPASSLVTVQSASDVEQADVVIVTPVLRRQFGSAISAVISDEPLAVYGTGSARVEADAVALAGASAYAAELASDRSERRTAGSALLRNGRVTFAQQGGAQARAQLSEGLVDTRVCTLLATLASAHTIVIAGFTPLGAGAGPDVPSSGVLVSSIDGTPVSAASSTVEAVLAVVNAQQSPYLALTSGVIGYGGSPALRIVFAQPGPLGLLGG